MHFFIIYRESGVGEAKLVPTPAISLEEARTTAENILKADPRRLVFIAKGVETAKTEMSILFRTA